MKNKTILLVLVLLLFISGCVSSSPFPMNGSQALKSESEFGVLTAQPDAFQGRAIKLAGRIIGVETTAEGTMVTAEWLPYPDAEYMGPVSAGVESPGQFVLFYPGQLDAEGKLYGNKFLVVGEKGGSQAMTAVRGTSQSLPYIAARCLHVWKTGNADIETESYTEYSYPAEETYCSDI
ncbi:Slp family lipoprotein [Nitrospira sp. M1]